MRCIGASSAACARRSRRPRNRLTPDAAPLSGRRVLLTRASSPSDRAADAFTALGAIVTSLPLVRIVPPADMRPLLAAAARADIYSWIAFTSANGVEAFRRARKANTALLRARIAAVGSATARSVVRCFQREVDLVPSEFTGAALGTALAARVRDGEPVLIVQAADARPDLERALSHLRPKPHAVVAYETIEEASPPETQAAVARADIVILASGSAARSLAGALRPNLADALRAKTIACIGPVTADEARRAGIPVAIVAGESTMTGVVAALVAHSRTT